MWWASSYEGAKIWVRYILFSHGFSLQEALDMIYASDDETALTEIVMYWETARDIGNRFIFDV